MPVLVSSLNEDNVYVIWTLVHACKLNEPSGLQRYL